MRNLIQNSIILEKSVSRGKWNRKEKEIMCKYFKTFITDKKAPKKKEVEDFKLKAKELFGNISWLRIKTFVYNQYKNNN